MVRALAKVPRAMARLGLRDAASERQLDRRLVGTNGRRGVAEELPAGTITGLGAVRTGALNKLGDDPEALEPLAYALPEETLVLREEALRLTRPLAEAFQAAYRASDDPEAGASCRMGSPCRERRRRVAGAATRVRRTPRPTSSR